MTENHKSYPELPTFDDLHMIVIGDVMIDRYISGDIKRISPEAPVPILEMGNIQERLGGAANVAANLHAMGAQATLISVIGNDEDGYTLDKMTKDLSGLNTQFVVVKGRKTTVKTRLMAQHQHLMRIDSEDTDDIEPIIVDEILLRLSKIHQTKKVDGIIIQDYNKGLLTPTMIQKIMEFSVKENVFTFVDPKEKNFFLYKHCTIFKPNKKEVSKAMVHETQDYSSLDKQLRSSLHHHITLITLGHEGVFISDGVEQIKKSTDARMIADVCGAGDTVISIISMCFIKSWSLNDIAEVANMAGGQVCEKPGVVPIVLDQLKNEWNHKIEAFKR